MNRSEIKNLLKKKRLTGTDAGRLIIADFIASYENSEYGRPDGPGFLSEEEKARIASSPTKPEDIQQYNNYRNVHSFLANMGTLINTYALHARLYLWRLYTVALEINAAERERDNSMYSPVIMTQKQYDELKKADIAEKMTWERSHEDVLIHAVQYYFEQYARGGETPFDAYFDASKEKPLANPRIRANWIMKDEAAPAGATLFNALEYAGEHYHSETTGSRRSIFELANDYPELYAAMVDHLAGLPGLFSFKAVEKKDFFKNCFAMADLYANNIMSYPTIVDTFCPDECRGVAVLQPNGVYLADIDERGYYDAGEPYWAEHLIENITLETRKNVKEWTYQAKWALAEYYSRKKMVELIGDFIDMPEVTVLIPDDTEIVQQIDDLNNIYALLCSGPDTKERSKMSEREFAFIDLDTLRPTEKAIETVKENVDFSALRGRKTEQFIAALRRDVSRMT